MTLRTFKERIIQTGSFEVIGIAIVSPTYAYLVGASMVHGFALITLLSIVVLIWSPIFNTLFDLIERNCTCRLACERPHQLRLVHAVMHEVTAVLITCPLLMLIGGHTLKTALLVNLGLTITYSVYTYFFHIVYDRIRPVRKTCDTVVEPISLMS
ncbi:PACE efflux transporter [Ruegeria atlantica]|uniref:PACE efflux transporter n=1 Tax=Ruegeria atlantica TaxID=81569 RepID=UPI00147D8D0E|nr:PACE efflux transporter [Ruegeria atlantica]